MGLGNGPPMGLGGRVVDSGGGFLELGGGLMIDIVKRLDKTGRWLDVTGVDNVGRWGDKWR